MIRLTLALVAIVLASATTASARGLHAVGNRLLDGRGRTLVLRGVNRSGTEYACIQGWGIFDGPNDAASVRALASWHANFVRVLINEDCWLGINRVRRTYGGTEYRRAITRYVALLHRYGLYAEVSLVWAAPARYQATYQSGAPDEDHSPAVWAGVAAAFRHDSNVILAPWGETVVDPRCFLRGGVCEATYGRSNTPYRIAGMQQAVDVMRGAGYRGVIAIPGVDYANDLSRWLAYEPHDQLHQLVAEAHVYGLNTCSSTACLNRTMGPVARRVPLIFGETGETYDASSCGSYNTNRFMSWVDANASGYAAWAWDTWGGCPSLIKDYSGTPANAYGAFVNGYYATHASTTYFVGR